jgi:hypothetical protein
MRTRYAGLIAMVSTLALAGCVDVFGTDGPEVTVSLGFQEGIPGPLYLRADIGGRRAEVAAANPGDDMAVEHARGPRYGEVLVRATVRTGAGDELGTVSFTQEFQRGQSHWIVASVGRRPEQLLCDAGVAAAPLRTGGADSLFVRYGGVPLSLPVYCGPPAS